MQRVNSEFLRPVRSTEVQQESVQKTAVERPVSSVAQETEQVSTRTQTEVEKLGAAQAATTRKSEQLFDTSMRRAILAQDLQKSGNSAPPIGVGAPEKTSPPSDPNEVLVVGSRGPQVEDFQNQLNGYRIAKGLPPINVTGIYTQETAEAVKEFQTEMGLDADSMAGPNTKARLELETDKNFKRMNNNVQGEIRDMLNQFQHNPAARDNLMKLVKDREFSRYLSPSSQIFALGLLKQNPANAKHFENTLNTAKDMALLEKDQFFQKLPTNTQLQIQDAMFEHHAHPTGREGIAELATNFQFSKLSEERQVDILKAIRANKDDRTAPEFVRILNAQGYGVADDTTRDRILDIALEHSHQTDVLDDLTNLLSDPKFVFATPEEKGNQLTQFRRDHGDIEIV